MMTAESIDNNDGDTGRDHFYFGCWNIEHKRLVRRPRKGQSVRVSSCDVIVC